MAESSAVPNGEAERDRIKNALEASGYVISRAAAALGYSEATMHRRIEAHGLQDLVRGKSRRIQRRRDNQEFPRAPHEVSRQAEDQRANRERGLCGCGKPPEQLDNGDPGRMCGGCRERARESKRAGARVARRRASTGAEGFDQLLEDLSKTIG